MGLMYYSASDGRTLLHTCGAAVGSLLPLFQGHLVKQPRHTHTMMTLVDKILFSNTFSLCYSLRSRSVSALVNTKCPTHDSCSLNIPHFALHHVENIFFHWSPRPSFVPSARNYP